MRVRDSNYTLSQLYDNSSPRRFEAAQTVRPRSTVVKRSSPRPARLHTGELEHQVMTVLWRSQEPLTPPRVHAVLSEGREIAYTTVSTILVRLWQKGRLTRSKEGRAYSYLPVANAEEHIAQRLRDVLAAAENPHAALGHFVRSLDSGQRNLIQRHLGRKNP